MRESDKFFDQKIREIAQREVLDIGGGRGFQKVLKPYKHLFKNYKTLDINGSYNPDIVGDIQDLPFPDNSIEAIFCNAVLEHVTNPIKAVDEIYRVLKPHGVALVCTSFLYPYHPCRDYRDYYRFTLDGLMWMFRKFTIIEYSPVRGRFETIVYLLPRGRKFLGKLARICDLFDKTETQSSSYALFVIK